MAAPPSDPPGPPEPAAPKAPRLPARLSTELDPDIDPAFPDIEAVSLSDVELSFPQARTVTVLRSRLSACVLGDDTEASVDAVDSVLVDLDLTGRTIEGLSRVTLDRCRLGGADFGGARLTDVELDGCVLDLASMRGAQLERIRINGGRVDGLDLAGARLKDTVFEDLPLGDVTLDGTRCERVDLTAADLAGVQDMTAIRGATISESQAIALSVRLARAAGLTIARP